MNSPLTLELIIQGTGGAGLVSGLAYLFKNPDKVGGWFGRLQAAWYDGFLGARLEQVARHPLHVAGRARPGGRAWNLGVGHGTSIPP
ncbi:hypothetical protein GCM10010176_072570 [Nonomuraea spiralis]|nr:hypothetical protein GCM10010176_072570 [Nonomuraea spiralis]